MKVILILSAIFGSALTSALELPPPVFVATAQEGAGLEAAVKAELKRANPKDNTDVKCHHIITVLTGGTLNTGTGGVCVLDGKEYQLSCVDNMVGNSASSPRLHPDLTEEYEILWLIADKCTGG